MSILHVIVDGVEYWLLLSSNGITKERKETISILALNCAGKLLLSSFRRRTCLSALGFGFGFSFSFSFGCPVFDSLRSLLTSILVGLVATRSNTSLEELVQDSADHKAILPNYSKLAKQRLDKKQETRNKKQESMN